MSKYDVTGGKTRGYQAFVLLQDGSLSLSVEKDSAVWDGPGQECLSGTVKERRH